jgi:hypothetical protein
MSVPQPLFLRSFTFIMSEPSTRGLACEVAELLQQENDTVFVEDFLGPIHDALHAMFELDWKRDLGIPRNSDRLLLPALVESTEGDMIKNLEKWFIDQFGPYALGRMGIARAKNNLEIADYSIVFRDATPLHIEGAKAMLRPAQSMFVHLGGGTTVGEPAIDVLVPAAESAETVVDLIRKAL